MRRERSIRRKVALLAAFCGCALTACGSSSEEPGERPSNPDHPLRVVSLDYCADQYVLKFVDRERILAISPEGTSDFSYMRDEAIGVPTVRPVAENVLILKPDLVVRSYGGGANAAAFFERAGIPVLNVRWTNTIDDVMANVERMATELGAEEKGRRVVGDMQARIESLRNQAEGQSTLYMTPGGATTGPGSLVHEVLLTAGLTNFQTQPGWSSLPLERLAYEEPDLVAASLFGAFTDYPDPWSPAKHPIAQRQLEQSQVAVLDGAWTACGGWFLVEAMEALAKAAAQ